MRKKIPELRMACAGCFGDEYAPTCTLHLEHIDDLTDIIAGWTAASTRPASLSTRRSSRATIPGIGQRAAQVIISELGVHMTRFRSAAHLASWAGLCPGNNESAGRHRSGKTRKGIPSSARPHRVACAAERTSTYVAPSSAAFIAGPARSADGRPPSPLPILIVIVGHVLAETTAYRDLGADYFTRRLDNPERVNANSSANSKPSATRSP